MKWDDTNNRTIAMSAGTDNGSYIIIEDPSFKQRYRAYAFPGKPKLLIGSDNLENCIEVCELADKAK